MKQETKLTDFCCSARESVSSSLRNKARRLRDHSHRLEQLADRLDCLGITGDAEEALWQEMVAKNF